ncbi:hypothetical protein N7532_007831 [Penicillium argentinense]|uniref:Uncharacterized protein n=1 Tax=Penicillium argentinense TaxID=1131581 RepID=A0A9W9K1Y0_9EURO|nr:uncharacterized protein N7532_007831 [Penicillium argentinense]KAJ5089147.1 hypothetical protein N7532_007831 [Penicillium argentinense]
MIATSSPARGPADLAEDLDDLEQLPKAYIAIIIQQALRRTRAAGDELRNGLGTIESSSTGLGERGAKWNADLAIAAFLKRPEDAVERLAEQCQCSYEYTRWRKDADCPDRAEGSGSAHAATRAAVASPWQVPYTRDYPGVHEEGRISLGETRQTLKPTLRRTPRVPIGGHPNGKGE